MATESFGKKCIEIISQSNFILLRIAKRKASEKNYNEISIFYENFTKKLNVSFRMFIVNDSENLVF